MKVWVGFMGCGWKACKGLWVRVVMVGVEEEEQYVGDG